jgi:STAM-binding protein
MLYVRHCNLVLNDLSKHPEAKVPENKNAIRKLARAIPNVMGELQTIKPVIEANHAEWLKINAAQVEARPQSRAAQTTKDSVRVSLVPAAAKVLDAGEHSDLAVELAQQALDRRAARRAARRGTITEQEEHERRTGGVWEDWEAKKSQGDQMQFTADQDLQRQMAATRRMLDQQDDDLRSSHQYGEYRPLLMPARPLHYSYPSISHPVGASYRAEQRPISAAVDLQQPPRPAKIRDAPTVPSSDRDVPPPVPGKTRYPPDEPSSLGLAPWDRDEAPQRPPKQPLKPLQKQHNVTFKASAYLEDGSPLRPLFLPDKLRSTFLSIAADNTRRGVEMCGILCGTKINGALFVSVLLIPEQTCTSDTCETENEWAISEFCEENTLEVFGWIHTHPTQTCFMSSRDLHTQAGYQTFLPESIAIVCSPRHEPS